MLIGVKVASFQSSYGYQWRVIIDKAQVTNALSLFIDNNSRLEKKTGKRLHHALEDDVGLKQGAFHRLANTTRRVIL